MPSFDERTSNIILQPGDSKVPYSFTFTINSSATANDGAIPFGQTVTSIVVTVHLDDADNTDKTSEVVNSSSLADNIATVLLDYPSTTGAGCYHLNILATLSGSAVMEFDFNRISARDI